METSTVNTGLMGAIGAAILSGSIYSAILLAIYHRKFRVAPGHLTRTITERSWNGRQTLLLLAAFIGFSLLLPLCQFIPGAVDTAHGQFLVVLVFSMSQITALILISRRRHRSWAEDFGMPWRQLRKLPLSLAIYLAILPAMGIITLAYQTMLEKLFGIEPDIQDIAQLIAASESWIKVGYIILAVVAAPLYEEMIFRGVLFPFLVRRIGMPFGMLVVSMFFAMLHFHVPTLMPLFLLSVALCLVYWRTESLWTSIGVHALFNGVTILVLLLQA